MTELPNKPALLAKARQLKLLILDVDGVLTDGRLFFDGEGNEYKSFHARDGHGIKLLRQTGVEVAVISGRKSASVALRMKNLGVEHVYQGHENKIAAFDEIIGKLGIRPEQAAHVGDDVLDLPVMLRVGLAIAVSDANFAVKQRADWCTELPGGQGAVREVCDFIMQAQGRFDDVLAAYLI
ncbi:MAG: 3-deoxy-manno-octulosonate-8-phosphatase KdsC [Methylobacter sp.]|nr:3-deoxy-manno-octulosonate-8-phosphatase KdsC [Methylobacter sp.]MDP2098342.1 3-deoxy-manno-octulosonate-8-phosphatase KdsC [Methylobacter sp.]MDP2430178.1 3-deoxy-manno-octulosonate-8-phosphatase KdsC [Methylobacter sp.]MDP3056363.1 3-deoxy-manno-octulosonate-8-phosphatase KdsC [Methylobacter sp.]MDP3363305.1 3-deoxy-manno-octulosonate-8-phosphatase KdsC [Methylobacter sp.]